MAEIKTRVYTELICPECGEDMGVVQFSYCKTNNYSSYSHRCSCCQSLWDVKINDDKIIAIDELPIDSFDTPGASERSFDLLVSSEPMVNPIYLVVLGYHRLDKNGEHTCHREYHYGEHTCPTNFLRVKAVSYQGDTDPHGVFEFVRSVTVREAAKQLGIEPREFFHNEDSRDYYAELFPEMLTKDLTIPGREDPNEYPKVLREILTHGQNWKDKVVEAMVHRGFVSMNSFGPGWKLEKLLELPLDQIKRLRNELIFLSK